jgi:hypothetical protein
MKDKLAIGVAAAAFVGMHFVPAGAATGEVAPPVNIHLPKIKLCHGVTKAGKPNKCKFIKEGEKLYG